MKKYLMLIAAAALMAVSCEKEIKNTPVDVTVSLEMNGQAYAAADITVSLRELNGSASFTLVTRVSVSRIFTVNCFCKDFGAACLARSA